MKDTRMTSSFTLIQRLAVLALGLFCVALPAAPEKTRQLLTAGREPVRIVCIGDSITGVYYHSGGLRAYPEMLEIALHKAYPQAQVTVRNAGISGDTTKGALARLDRDVIAHKPHLVTVMFGMNDLVGTPLAVFQKNLKEIVARCRAAGAEVVLCTQNSVVETPTRPCSRLAEFTQAIRDMAKEESLGLADCHSRFEEVRAKGEHEWSLLLSDTIHPNMDGHKLFASEIAKVISEKDIDLNDIGPPRPAMRHTVGLLKEGKPIKVLAMPPYDQLIGPALTRLFPDAQVAVTPWPTEGQSLVDIETYAKKVRSMSVDLVLIAVPPQATTPNPKEFASYYTWTMNWSLSFGVQQWDVLVITPSVAKPDLADDEQQREALARRLMQGKDLHRIERTKGDETPMPELFATWITRQMPPQPKQPLAR